MCARNVSLIKLAFAVFISMQHHENTLVWVGFLKKGIQGIDSYAGGCRFIFSCIFLIEVCNHLNPVLKDQTRWTTDVGNVTHCYAQRETCNLIKMFTFVKHSTNDCCIGSKCCGKNQVLQCRARLTIKFLLTTGTPLPVGSHY